MNLDIPSAVFGFVGALLGASVSIATTAMSNNAQVRRARQERTGRVADAQREAYITFLSQGDHFLDLARELADLLDAGLHEGDPGADDCFHRYSAEWTKFAVSSAAVQISGPPNVADFAQELKSKIGARGELIDQRYKDGKQWRDNDNTTEAAAKARADFIHQAQIWLNAT